MRRALIGFGTPLGSYLAQRRTFADCYTYKQASKGIAACSEAVIVAPAGNSLGGKSLGALAHALVAALKKGAGRIVLLSSIDVYSCKGLPLDETAKPAGSPGNTWLPLFESEILACCLPANVLRIPDVFGLAPSRGSTGSLLIGDASKINRVAIHQWYPARRLESDIAIAREVGAPIVNLVSEPLPMNAVLKQFFPGQFGQVRTPAPYSRIRTRYAGPLGGSGGYIMSAAEVLEEIGRYLRAMGISFASKAKASAAANHGGGARAAACG
jgi:hypothetical protein